jgi:ubiquinone/menaquinone biosynthesis C-methylase UbiE
MNRQNRSEGWQLEPNSAEAYERYLASAFSPWAEQLVALAALGAGERVLDAACGTGIVARHAATRVGATGSVIGVDINGDMLQVARRTTAGLKPEITWRQADVHDLPFPEDAFDAIFCEQALQFFSEPVKALAEMRRVLARRGRAAISVCRSLRHSPTYAVLAEALDRHISPAAAALMRSPFAEWNATSFRSLFTNAGFAAVHVSIESCSLRYPSCQEFLRREAASSPLAAAVAALDDPARGKLIAELEAALRDHIDDDGLVCPLEVYVAVARRDT